MLLLGVGDRQLELNPLLELRLELELEDCVLEGKVELSFNEEAI